MMFAGSQRDAGMEERLGLQFSDCSILVLPDRTSVEAAKKEAEGHDAGDPNPQTKVLRIVLSDVKIIVG
jgi:hypothetical protein